MGNRSPTIAGHAFAAALLATAFGACTPGDSSQPTPSSPSTRPAPPTTPPRADYRLSGPSCGDVVVDHTGRAAQAPLDCLLAAAEAGRAANLVATIFTVEGDPVFYAFQVTAPDEVDLTHDARWDGFGSLRLTRQRCSVAATGGFQITGQAGRSLATAQCRPAD